MLTDTLIPQIKAKFSGKPFVIGSPPGPAVTFPAAHPDVGDLAIYDDGDEITVYLGKFTHVHFDHNDDEPSEAERSAKIVEKLIAFLDDVFADRIEFFGSHTGGGGYRVRGSRQRGVISRFFFGAKTYVWSGPVSKDS